MLKYIMFLVVLNFDAFVSGLALGLGGIMVKSAAGVLVAVVSSVVFAVSLGFGAALVNLLPVVLLHRLGILLLLFLTLLWLIKFCGPSHGGLAGIWRCGEQLDANADQNLAMGEAALLAVALSLDSLGGGLAFGLLGQEPLLWGLMSALVAWVMFVGANWLGREMCHMLAESHRTKNRTK